MALTTNQLADILFKKYITGKTTTKTQDQTGITPRSYFEEPINTRPHVIPSDIWSEAGSLPFTASNIPGLLQFITVTMSHIAGSNNLSYYDPNGTLVDIVPYNFSSNNTYAYQIYKNDGVTPIPLGGADWLFDNNAGVLSFFDESLVANYVSAAAPPVMKVWKYIGAKGTVNVTGGAGLTVSNGNLSLNVDFNSGLTYSNAGQLSIAITKGLTNSNGVIGVDINTDGGLTFSGNQLKTAYGTGLTSSAGVLQFNTNLGTGNSITYTSGSIQVVDTPVNGNDLTNKFYVDAIASGLDVKEAVYLATTAPLPTYTYSNGPSASFPGLGAYIIASSNGYLVIDGVTVSNGKRILVKNESSDSRNGIYIAATAGDGSNPFYLVRSTDFDGSPAYEINGGEFTFVQTGNTWASTGWVVTNPFGFTISVGTDPIQWVQFSAAGVYLPGDGLSQAGTTFNVNTVNGLTISSDAVALGGTLNQNTTIDGSSTYDFNITNTNNTNISPLTSLSLGTNTNAGNVTIGSLGNMGSNTYLYGKTTYVKSSGSGASTYIIGENPGNWQTFLFMDDSSAYINSGYGGFQGLRYAADFSGNFVSYSLVTKQYVDSVVSSVGATNGLTETSPGIIGLGGSLGQNTNILGNTYSMSMGTSANRVSNFKSYASSEVQFNVNDGVSLGSSRILPSSVYIQYNELNGTYSQVRTYNSGTEVISANGPSASSLVINIAPTSITNNSTNNSIVITDDISSKGAVYNADYSANFTPESLVSKRYVDNLLSAQGASAGSGLSENINGIFDLGGTVSMNTILNFSNSYSMLFDNFLNFELSGTAISLTASSDFNIHSDGTLDVSSIGNFTLGFNGTGVVTDGSGTPKGLEYASDYSANFTGNSLVTKTYVDSKSSYPSTSDKKLNPATASSNGVSTTLAITNTPALDSYVQVYVNGQLQILGNGSTASCDAYFSNDGGATARLFTDVTASDTLYWNATYAGFNLYPSDIIDICYNVLV